MRGANHETPVLKSRMRPAMAALGGLIAAVICLLVFILQMRTAMPIDFGDLIVYFMTGGVGAGLAFLFLYDLLPQRKPGLLFSESIPLARTEVPLSPAREAVENASTANETIRRVETDPIKSAHPPRSISRYKAREGPGAVGVITIIGICLVLGGRVRGGWEFLSFVIPAGCAVALLLYWSRGRQEARGIFRYGIRVSGGIIVSAAMIGIAMVMMRFAGLRYFLGLAIGAGIAVALVLQWRDSRHSNSSLVT